MRNDYMIRDYEVSLWTLQDGFIAVLKQPNINHKGQIQNPIEKINIDGTQELTFTIPMYLNQPDGLGNNNKIENPIWYNTRNGNLMVNMRKIKVILNKNTEEEAIHEYIINKINERHEKGELYCDVECEGLAFNELGKIGYKIVLNQDDFLYDYEEWFKGTDNTSEPRETIQYWLKKLSIDPFPTDNSKILPNKWYYEIKMSWNSSGNVVGRAGNKIYEEEYTSSWALNNNNVVPVEFSTLKEKERPIDISESNMYNITQQLAEIFGVFCKYEYGYDENYHIIYRKIIYYNNFIEEEKGHMDISYPYHSSKITRESDGTDLVTKMYIRTQDTENELLNIMDASPNKSKEDYILNFDYLHELNIISEEQYKGIKEFEDQMFNINSQLKSLSTEIDVINNQILEEETNKSTAEKAKIAAEEQFNNANDHWTALGGDWQNTETGIIKVDGFNSKVLIVLEDKRGVKYVDIPFLGVIPSSVRLYSGILNYIGSSPYSNCVLIENYSTELDEYGNLIRITNLPTNLSTSTLLLSCEYIPKNYWEKVRNYWIIGKTRYSLDFENAENELNKLNDELARLEPIYNSLLDQKKELISKFEQMMGPALREGYWQPDDYFDYNTNYIINFNNLNEEKKNEVQYYWDNETKKGEDKITFIQGNDERQYLMVKLNSSQFNYIKQNYDNLSFMYYDESIVSLLSSATQMDKSNLFHSIHLNGGCQLGFILNDSLITPVLIITESKLFTINQLNFFKKRNNNYLSRIGVITYNVQNGKVITTIDSDSIIINSEDYIFGNDNVGSDPLLVFENNISLVRPRILIESPFLNTSSSELFIKLNNTKLLIEYEDYYITKDYDKTYITIKSDTFFKLGTMNPSLLLSYSLSTASTAIYLDAVQIAKENAYPKVSYTVDLTLYDPSIIYNIYNKLSRIVHINDVDLKFQNVQGYISEVELDLDHPWNDKIEIKNYKTKFEDLFSTIMASTTDIQKNGYRYNIAANGFNKDGTLSEEIFKTSLDNNSLVFNNFLNSNFDNIDIINQKLENLFNEAGQMLSTANSSLTNMQSLTVSNANILSGFYAGVQEGFANGIDYSNEITLITGDIANVSAIRINKDDGIYIGSNKKIILSATNAIKNDQGEYINDPQIPQSGANVELSPQRLLMGVSNLSNGNGGVVDITSDQIILAVGNNVQILQNDSSKQITTEQNLTGVQIKKDYIGLATVDNGQRSIVSIKPTDITLGTKGNDQNGSYVMIAQDKLELGSSADLYINTNNFKIQTNYSSNGAVGNTIFAVGSNLSKAVPSTNINSLTSNDLINFLINQSGTFINGPLTIAGAQQSGYYPFFKVENNTMGIFRSSTGTTDISSSKVDKLLYFENGNLRVKGDIIASNFYLNGDAVDQFNAAVASSPAVVAIESPGSISSQLKPIVINGIGSGTWNGVDYGVILGNANGAKPMLIGSNSGLTIAADITAPSSGEAIILNNSGIELRGGTIKLNSVNDGTMNIINLNENGISLASTAEINMETGGKFNVFADSGIISLGNHFTIDSEGNLRCKSITCETLNGKDVSNLIINTLEDQTVETIYGSGNKIWFSGGATPIHSYGGQSYGTENIVANLNIKLDYNIKSENRIRIKLAFSERPPLEAVGITECVIRIGEQATTTFSFNDQKIYQGNYSVISNAVLIGAISPGTYQVTLKITCGYTSTDQEIIFYPAQSYIETM